MKHFSNNQPTPLFTLIHGKRLNGYDFIYSNLKQAIYHPLNANSNTYAYAYALLYYSGMKVDGPAQKVEGRWYGFPGGGYYVPEKTFPFCPKGAHGWYLGPYFEYPGFPVSPPVDPK